MANIIECPICDAKYDISSVKDGSKLRCAKCKRIIGTIMGGNLLPMLETIKPKDASPFDKKKSTPPPKPLHQAPVQTPVQPPAKPAIEPVRLGPSIQSEPKTQLSGGDSAKIQPEAPAPAVSQNRPVNPTGQPMGGPTIAVTAVSQQSRREDQALTTAEPPVEASSEPANKPSFLLVLAGLTGAAAIIALIYIIYSLK